ncbi:hypothetical protein P171DRAFT_493155 [Karstenula rhodostoma CBS 690.94]|uniref:Uncharacterized protein n=1 Tax=Karstenula rhodostoma CBS 690.94 TaxID=1392251 RepID=A0A9P4PZG0_9PLEO|nr:hypothetical protein P171DRAFT_493155 [Karstenula rhodostoma CBS 690.94]
MGGGPDVGALPFYIITLLLPLRLLVEELSSGDRTQCRCKWLLLGKSRVIGTTACLGGKAAVALEVVNEHRNICQPHSNQVHCDTEPKQYIVITNISTKKLFYYIVRIDIGLINTYIIYIIKDKNKDKKNKEKKIEVKKKKEEEASPPSFNLNKNKEEEDNKKKKKIEKKTIFFPPT